MNDLGVVSQIFILSLEECVSVLQEGSRVAGALSDRPPLL